VLEHVWFKDQAKKAIPGGKHAIYAVSISGTKEIPVPFKSEVSSTAKLYGVDVTQRYTQ